MKQILEATASAIAEIDEQIASLRAKRSELEEIRRRAEKLADLTGGGMAETAVKPKPRPRPAKPAQAASPRDRRQRILDAVRTHQAASRSQIVAATGIRIGTLQDDLRALVNAGLLERRGAHRSTRYLIALDPPSPTDAPPTKAAPRRSAQQTEAERAERRKGDKGVLARKCALEVLAASEEPLERRELIAAIAEKAEVGASSARQAINHLVRHRTVTRLDRDGGVFYRAGAEMAPPIGGAAEGPRTATEKAVFDTVASFPKTASEVAANLQGSASRQSNAATILEGLVRRGVLARRPGSSPAVYEVPEPLGEAA